MKMKSTKGRELLLLGVASVIGFTVRHTVSPIATIKNEYLQLAIVVGLVYSVYVLMTWMAFEDGPHFK
jgi:hypothetical protein